MIIEHIVKTIRAAVIATNNYVAGTILTDCKFFNQFNLLVTYVKGSSTSAEVLVQFSPDGVVYYDEVNATVTAGSSSLVTNEYTFPTAGNYLVEIPVAANYIKVSSKVSGTVTNSSITVRAILINNV